MGEVAPVIDAVSNVTQEIVEEVPIVGQPAAELVQEVSKPVVQIAEDIDKPFIELYQEIGLLPEAPEGGGVQEQQPSVPEQNQTPTPRSSRQFSEQAQRTRRRGSLQQGSALGSILLAPSVLGTKSSVLGGQTGNLG